MRIAGGALRGRVLKVAAGTRPTGGRVREALFDIWAGRIADSRFLDLFAGSGAVGLEALSRGAARCLAVESSASVLRHLRPNYEKLAGERAWALSRVRLPEGLAGPELIRWAPFDLVFADPPYAFPLWQELLAGVAPLLADGGEACVEHGRRNRPPSATERLELRSRRAYGESELSFYGPPSGEPLSEERPR